MKLPKQFYYKRNHLQQLKGFYYTVQTGSISKAAEKMSLNQSTVTLQIQSLERDLGMKLFERSRKKIEITNEGKAFYEAMIPHIHGIDELFSNFRNRYLDDKANFVNLAANHVSISYILPKYIKKFKDDFPQTRFQIRNLSKDEAIKRLMDDKIDIFIYPFQSSEIPHEFDFIPVVTYQPILLITKDHPLATKKNITLNDVKQYELVRIDPKFITLPAFEEIIKTHGLKSRIEFEMSDWEILKRFVSAKVGVAIISNILLEGDDHGDLTGRVLTNYFPEMTYGILFKKGKKFNGLLKNFIELLSKEKLLQAQKN